MKIFYSAFRVLRYERDTLTSTESQWLDRRIWSFEKCKSPLRRCSKPVEAREYFKQSRWAHIEENHWLLVRIHLWDPKCEKSAGDVDILIHEIPESVSGRETERQELVFLHEKLLVPILEDLTEREFLKDNLTWPNNKTYGHGRASKRQKTLTEFYPTVSLEGDLTSQSYSEATESLSLMYMGVCRLQDDLPFRRIDIKVTQLILWGLALSVCRLFLSRRLVLLNCISRAVTFSTAQCGA